MVIVSSRIVLNKQGGFVAEAVKTDTGAKFRIGAAGWTPGTQAMYGLGQFGIDLIKARVKRGVGSDDNAMKPLRVNFRKDGSEKRGYKWRKQKAGLSGIRDLTGLNSTDHMLDNLTVRYASETETRMDFTKTTARVKARANEKLDPWFGWSLMDLTKLGKASALIFGDFVATATFRNRNTISRIAAAHPWLKAA